MLEDINLLHARDNPPDNPHIQGDGVLEGPAEAGEAKDSESGGEELALTHAELKEQIAFKKNPEKEIRKLHKEVKHLLKRKMRAEQKKRRELSLPVSTELGDLIKKVD